MVIFAIGHLVREAIQDGERLVEMGIDAEIINIHTIKPLDREAILKSVAKTRCVVSAEEHNRLGGLGDSIAQAIANLFHDRQFLTCQCTIYLCFSLSQWSVPVHLYSL